MRKHRTKTMKSLFSKSLDCLITLAMEKALGLAAEAEGVKISQLVRTILRNHLQSTGWMPKEEPTR